MSRRSGGFARAVRATAALVLVAVLAACGGPPGRRVLVYSAHGKDLLEDVEKGFEATHPGVDVVWLDMGADACFDRLRGERADPQADVWWGGTAFRFAQAADQGLLLAHEPSWSAACPPGAHDAAWRWTGQFAMPQVIAFHRDQVKDPPHDWDDLATPAWKGRIVLRDPWESGGMTGALGAIFAAKMQATGTDDAANAWFRGVVANLRAVVPSPAALFDAIRRDDRGTVTIWNLTDVLYQSEVADPPVPFGWSCPASGAPTFPDCIALVARGARAPNPDAAAFFEYATSAAVSSALAEKHRRFLVRTDVPKPSWAARIDCRAMDVDWAFVGAHVDAWRKAWKDALSAR